MPNAPNMLDRPEITFITSKHVPFANYTKTKNLDKSILHAREVYVLLVACKKYEKVRKDKPEWKDIEKAYENCDTMKSFLQKRYIIPEDNISYLKDPSYDELDKTIKEWRDLWKSIRNDPSSQVLFIIACSGHGVMATDNYMVLNEEDKFKRFYPLENTI